MRRAIEHFEALGLGPPAAVMSDNGNCYRSYAYRAELERVGARQILTPPYTPRWNGKVCVLASGCRPVWRRGCPRPAV